MAYTVGDAARIARISVRTLHHDDEIGLVRPSERSGAVEDPRFASNYEKHRARLAEYIRDAIRANVTRAGAR